MKTIFAYGFWLLIGGFGGAVVKSIIDQDMAEKKFKPKTTDGTPS